MSRLSARPIWIALIGIIGVSVAIAISSFGVVRAQRFLPPGNVTYKCSSGQACVTSDATGKPWAVLGVSGSNGIVGESSGLGKAGVWGVSLAKGSGGFGVVAESADTSGKYPALVAQGDKSSTSLFYADNRANNASCTIDPSSNLKCTGTVTGQPVTATSAGVIGVSNSNYGVYGTSVDSEGVYGASTYSVGVHGFASSNGATGVDGVGNGSAYGVYGLSSSNTGVTGESSSGDGVFGYSSSGVGVAANSTSYSNAGVLGDGKYFGVLGLEESSGGIALTAESLNPNGFVFNGYGVGSNGGQCTIDFHGNLTCTGKISGGHGVELQHTIGGQRVVAYTSESTSATIEDVGEARIASGTASVRLGSGFASMIDRSKPYYVFLTPLGETRGLYVSTKAESGFQVREVGSGHSDVAFDYRVVGYPLDSAQNGPPPGPAPRRPLSILPNRQRRAAAPVPSR